MLQDITNENRTFKPGLVSFSEPAANQPSGALINASAMARSFGKNPSDWLRLSSTKKYLAELARVKDVPVTELFKKVKKTELDGREKGIWLHEEAALEFSRWLSPLFAIWNNQRTKELLLTGKTERQPQADSLPAVASNLLSQQVEWLDEALQEQTRKADYHDAVLQSRTLIPATLIAKELGMSAGALNKWLHEHKVLYKTDTHWVLYSDYQGKGYTGTKTALYLDSAGKYQSNIHTYWTEKGREFIHSLFHSVKQIA